MSDKEQNRRKTPVSLSAQTPEAIEQLIHELQVHQVELELQNEELRTAQAEIEAGQARYFDLYDLAPVGYVTDDEAGLILEANLTVTTLLGVNRGALLKQPLTRFILREDQDIYYLHRKKLFESGVPRRFELRLVRPGGTAFWALLDAAFAGEGEPAGESVCRVVLSDITERKLAEEKLREDEKLQQLLMNLATDLINVPLEKVDTAINEMFKAVGQFTQADRVYIFKHDFDRRVTSNTHEWCAEGITPEIDNMQDFPFEMFADYLEAHQRGEIVHIPDVTQMPVNHALRPVFEDQGIQSMVMLPMFSEDVNTGFVGFDAVRQKKAFTEQEINLLKVLAEITSNILAREKTERNIRYMSFHDQLTGLYNRHYLQIEMERLDTKRQLPLAVIMADLNGLKLVNDTYGHEMGDEMLKTAADILRNSCREEDIIARWGGDEFVVLLAQTDLEETRLICKRIKEGCRGAFVVDVPVSIALGIAAKTSEATSLSETLQKAESEMYKQKLTESRSTKSAVVTALLDTLAAKSFETEEHTRGMQKIAQKIGTNLNLTDSELHRLELLITLHDIGKINIAEAILTKKSSLTDDEWEAIRKHPEIGYRIAIATEGFAHVAEDILAHHERWDSTGYPQGLKENNISLLARITAIADAYEVMNKGRPYKNKMSKSEITAEFKRCAGTHFDPELVKIFLSVIDSGDSD